MTQTYSIGGGWGDRIEFFPEWRDDSKTQRVCGWKERRPVAGDILRIPMASGKTLFSRFTNVKYYSDPPDMFWADVYVYGYEEIAGDAIYGQAIWWTDYGGGISKVSVSGFPSHEMALEKALEAAKRQGWTPPKWWQWWRWKDWRP